MVTLRIQLIYLHLAAVKLMGVYRTNPLTAQS